MKAASANSTFLVDDPIWAEDFAPNGEYLTHQKLNAASNSGAQALFSKSGTQLQEDAMPSELTYHNQAHSPLTVSSTLEKIANQGPDAFYEGELGELTPCSSRPTF